MKHTTPDPAEPIGEVTTINDFLPSPEKLVPKQTTVEVTIELTSEDQMNRLTVELPPNIFNDEAKLFLAAKLYEMGKLSLGKAAELSGYSKRTFIELISKMDIAIINYPADDLERELDL